MTISVIQKSLQNLFFGCKTTFCIFGISTFHVQNQSFIVLYLRHFVVNVFFSKFQHISREEGFFILLATLYESIARLVVPVDEEAGEADELVLVAVQEGVTVASPFDPDLVSNV